MNTGVVMMRFVLLKMFCKQIVSILFRLLFALQRKIVCIIQVSYININLESSIAIKSICRYSRTFHNLSLFGKAFEIRPTTISFFLGQFSKKNFPNTLSHKTKKTMKAIFKRLLHISTRHWYKKKTKQLWYNMQRNFVLSSPEHQILTTFSTVLIEWGSNTKV